MIPRDGAPRWRRLPILTVGGFVLALIALVAWGLSSPVGSSPDDDFHLASIWCGAGERAGLCEAAADPDERVVAKDLITAPCFAYDSEKSAACQPADFGLDPGTTVSTDRVNLGSALYPPVYYFVMSAFAGPDITLSVLGIRIFSSVLFVGFVAAIWALLPSRRRPYLVLPLVVTLVPLGVSLIPSTNPSGWALLSAGTLWIALLGYFETTGWRRIGLGAAAVASALIGAGARSDAAAFAAVAVGAALILAFTPTRRYFLSALLPLAIVVIAVAFFFSGSQSAAASGGLNGLPPVTTETLKSLLLVNTLNVPQLWAGVFGYWGLGWLDTALPAAVWFSGIGLFVAAVAAGVRSISVRKGIAVALMAFTIWAFPMVLLVQTQAYVGAYIQPRYILPLIVVFAGVALLKVTDVSWSLTRLQIALAIGAVALANSVSLHANIRRYVTGDDVVAPNLDSAPEWWWNLQFSPTAVWLVGTLAFTGMLILIAHSAWQAAEPAGRAGSARWSAAEGASAPR